MRRTLLFLLPVLLLKAEPQRFIAGSESIQIQADGWSAIDGSGGLRFRGMSRSAAFDTVRPLGKFSYFVGRDASRWIRGAPSYARIRETNVYRGVDVVYYGGEKTLEYDFVIRPRADARRISLVWTGAGDLRLDAEGSLVLPGNRKLAPPAAYQVSGNDRVAVPCRYVVRGKSVRFELGRYDRSRTLVVDPQVLFARLSVGYSGSIAVDRDGNSYVAGSGAPPTTGAYQSSLMSNSVTKRDKNGSAVWTAVIGPASFSAVSIALDGANNVYIAGSAYPDSFPITPGAFPSGSGPHLQTVGFISKLSADGTQLLYSTLLNSPLFGASGANQTTALAVSPEGQMTVAGTLFGTRTLPTGQTFAVRQPGSFVARISSDGTRVLYSQPLVGIVTTIALDALGNAVVAGTGSQADKAPISLQTMSADSTFYATADGGATAQTYVGLPASNGIAFDPTNPLSLLRSTYGGVFQSADGGAT